MRQRRRLTVVSLLLTLAITGCVFVALWLDPISQPISLLSTGLRQTNGFGVYESFLVSNTTSRTLRMYFVTEYRADRSSEYQQLPGGDLEQKPSEAMVLSFPVPATSGFWHVAAYSFRPRRNFIHELVDWTYRKLRRPAPGSAASYSEEFHTPSLKP